MQAPFSPLPTPLAGGVVRQRLRQQRAQLVCDVATALPDGSAGVALYLLSDPRTVRAVRYVGQSRAPVRRYTQHVHAACLPQTLQQAPWWLREPRLLPLYQWIRALYADGGRLPFMLITERAPSVAAARGREQLLIAEHHRAGHELLNHEALRPEPACEQLLLPLGEPPDFLR
jgi:hypothetical protein